MQFGLREIVFILLLLGVPAAAYFFVFEPRNQQIDELKEEIKQKQAKLTHLESVTRNIPDLDAEIARLTEASACRTSGRWTRCSSRCGSWPAGSD